MNCFDCAALGDQVPAVAICADCGAAICQRHAHLTPRWLTRTAVMRGTKEKDEVRTPEAARRRISWRALAVASAPALVVAAGVIAAALAPGALAGVSADMAKIGSVAFGNGLVILSVLQQDALARHWVTVS